MSTFAIPVRLYMSAPVVSVAPGALLDDAQRLLHEHRISSLAVVEGEKLAGVVSRTDLLRVGRRQAGARATASLLTLPHQDVASVMTRDVLTVLPEAHVSDAARQMVKHHVHRVFVVDEGGALAGVLSTKDLLAAIQDKRLARPLSDYMASPVFSVRVEDPLSVATARLEQAHVAALVVLEGEWPVGIFTQQEALASRDLPRATSVEEAMSPALLCYDARSALHRAAAQAAALDVRLVVATEDRKVVGVLSGTDFARATL